MNSLAKLTPPLGRARLAPEPVSCAARAHPLTALSMRDEEIVVRSRAGELPHDIARALDHDLLDVMRALNRAIVLGLRIQPTHAATADSRDRRTVSHAPGH